jgi:hypothetical protein
VLLKLPGDVGFEVVEPLEGVRHLYAGPVVAITVDEVAGARREMQSQGVEFLTPVYTSPQGWGWTYFRAPDGNVYQIQGPHRP